MGIFFFLAEAMVLPGVALVPALLLAAAAVLGVRAMGSVCGGGRGEKERSDPFWLLSRLRVALWVCGSVGLWVCGSVGLWARGLVGSWA